MQENASKASDVSAVWCLFIPAAFSWRSFICFNRYVCACTLDHSLRKGLLIKPLEGLALRRGRFIMQIVIAATFPATTETPDMTSPARLALIDSARTGAILAMVIFHFTYDLELFGFAPRGTIASREWILFAQGIAGSFLFLSGISLVLATKNHPIALRKYLIRLVQIGAGAIAVTLGTYIVMGSSFVRFGILHHMFAASILGLLFLRLPFWANATLGAAILAWPHLGPWHVLTDTFWLWLGKTSTPLPPMVDYVPILPWFGAFLLGMALAGWLTHADKWAVLATSINPNTRLSRILSWPGQHTLAIYLIHQPVLFGGVYLGRMIVG